MTARGAYIAVVSPFDADRRGLGIRLIEQLRADGFQVDPQAENYRDPSIVALTVLNQTTVIDYNHEYNQVADSYGRWQPHYCADRPILEPDLVIYLTGCVSDQGKGRHVEETHRAARILYWLSSPQRWITMDLSQGADLVYRRALALCRYTIAKSLRGECGFLSL